MTRLLLLAALAASVSCGSRGKQPGGQKEGPPPEERFGNDLALVTRFAELKSCPSRAGRLDITCSQLTALRQQVERAADDPDRRGKLQTTLLNLLDSQRELTRLIAAESLYPLHRDAKVRAALIATLERETSPTVKAMLLRQLCWDPGAELPPGALALLRSGVPEPVRIEAASCLAHLQRLSPQATTAARQALQTDPAAAVKGSLCEALGRGRVEAAVPEMATQLASDEIGWRCAMGLAGVGSQRAYEALVRALGEALKKGRVPTPLISAVASFSGQTFFERATVEELLEQAIEERRLGVVARRRAVLELRGLGASQRFYRLRQKSYAKPSTEADRAIREELDRAYLGR